jgi:ribonuclease Z
MPKGLTRRDALKLSGMTLGGLAAGSRVATGRAPEPIECTGGPCPSGYDTRKYTYGDNLPTFRPWSYDYKGDVTGTKLDKDEMRITFMGSTIPPSRRAQQEMSVFVEVGWDDATNAPVDHFIFDCGSGVSANYSSAGVGYGRMDKIFLNHLHGDHMSDLSHIYCFGPSGDRISPLYVWGPGPSGVKSPRPPRRLYDDGTKAFCRGLREAMRWHSESFGFQQTSYDGYERPTRESWGLPCDPVPVGDDSPDDGYAIVPIELPWRNYGRVPGDNVAYHNEANGAKVTHFPVIHCRQGSVGYKLEWNGLTMIYTSDTKPEKLSIAEAVNQGRGVDVFIHEMVVPPEVWAYKNMGLPGPLSGDVWDKTVNRMKEVQASSHTPQGAFGYLLSRIQPRPRLAVATHFPVADDTVHCALESVRRHCDWIEWDESRAVGNLTWSCDLMMLRVFPNRIQQLKAEVNDFCYSPPVHLPCGSEDLDSPKYASPMDQLDTTTQIEPGPYTYCEDGY